MAPLDEPDVDEVGSAVLGTYPAIGRLVGGSIGFSVGAAVGCFGRLVPALNSLDPISSTLLGGVIGTMVGLVIPVRIDRPKVPHLPMAVLGSPVPVTALGAAGARALDQPTATALVLGAAIGIGALPLAFVAFLLIGIRPSIAVLGLVALAGFAAAVACASFLPAFLLPKPTRSALAAFIWLGGREFRRIFGSQLAFVGFPVTPEEVGPWLVAYPETEATREGHVELHLLAGDWHAARATLERLPERTPRERFSRRLSESTLGYQLTGEVDDSEAREAMGAIPPGLDRVEAAVGLAAFEARRRLPDGDWRQPLLDVRAMIPGSDFALLLRDPGWVLFVYMVRQTWTVFALIAAVTLAGVVTSLLLGGGG